MSHNMSVVILHVNITVTIHTVTNLSASHTFRLEPAYMPRVCLKAEYPFRYVISLLNVKICCNVHHHRKKRMIEEISHDHILSNQIDTIKII